MGERENLPEVLRVRPHSFFPLRPWDLRLNGRCRRCLLPMSTHPLHMSAPARAIGDKRPAELSWTNLHLPDSDEKAAPNA